MRPKTPFALGGLALAVLVAGSGLAFATSDDSPAPVQVRLAAAERGTVVSTVTAAGSTVDGSRRDLAFGTPGTLTKVSVKVGSHVKKGQVLARTDSRAARESYTAAQADVSAAQETYDDSTTTSSTCPTTSTTGTTGTSSTGTSSTGADAGGADAGGADAAGADSGAARGLAGPLVVALAAYTPPSGRRSTSPDDEPAVVEPTDQPTVAPPTEEPHPRPTATVTVTVTATATVTVTARPEPSTTTNPTSTAHPTATGNPTATSRPEPTGGPATTPSARPSATPKPTAKPTTKPTSTAKPTGEPTRKPGATAKPTGGPKASARPSTGGRPSTGSCGKGMSQDQAKANLDRAEAALEQAAQAVRGTKIVAPASGTVLAVGGGTGDASGSGTFVSLGNLNELQIQAMVTESDVNRLKLGQQAKVTLATRGDQQYDATVTRMAPAATVSDQLVRYSVTLAFAKPPKGLMLGQTASVSITTGTASDAVYVPAQAVHARQDGTATVTVRAGGRDAARTVRTGIRSDQFVQITEGLSDGDQVVLQTGTAGEFPDGAWPS